VTITAEDQHLPDEAGDLHDLRVNGTLELTAAGELAYAQQRVVDHTIPLVRPPEASNFVTPFTQTGTTSGTFAFGGSLPTVGYTWETSPVEKLGVTIDAAHRIELQRFTPGTSDTFQVRGTITLADGTPAFHSPHVSIAFLLRNGFDIDPRDDQIID